MPVDRSAALASAPSRAGRALIASLASTVDVLSAVPAGYAFGYRRTGSLLPASWKIWQYSPAVCAGRRCGSSVVPVADR
jgi:hypothetical protein